MPFSVAVTVTRYVPAFVVKPVNPHDTGGTRPVASVPLSVARGRDPPGSVATGRDPPSFSLTNLIPFGRPLAVTVALRVAVNAIKSP